MLTAAAFALVAVGAIAAGQARIRLAGPTEVVPGRAYDLLLQADNTALAPEKTRSIDWRVTGPDYVQWLSVVLPPSPDFFSDSSWAPVPTYSFFYMPPTSSARSTVNPADAVLSRTWSNVARYSFQINAGYTASLPAAGSFTVVDADTTFWSSTLQKQPYVDDTPTYVFVIKLSRADFDRNMKIDPADAGIFEACFTGPNVPYDLGNLPSGCTCGTVNVGGQNYLNADFDNDGDVDHDDFGIFQRCYSGNAMADATCGN